MSLAKPWHNCLAQLFRRRSFQSRSSFTMRLGSETELSLAATDPQISSCASTRIPRCAFLQTNFVSFLYISCQNNALLMHAVRLPVYGGGQGDGADTEDLRLRVPTTAAAGVEQLWQREGDRGHLGQGFPNQGEEVVAWRLEIAVSYFGHFQRIPFASRSGCKFAAPYLATSSPPQNWPRRAKSPSPTATWPTPKTATSVASLTSRRRNSVT